MMHCLIVDDSDIIRKYARLIFESLNFRVSESEQPADAAERIGREVPDFILVDWRIQGHVMHEFIGSIRQMKLDKRPYIIYLVTENDSADIHRALKAGADDYLLKPFNREIIEMKLHEIRVAA